MKNNIFDKLEQLRENTKKYEEAFGTPPEHIRLRKDIHKAFVDALNETGCGPKITKLKTLYGIKVQITND